MDNKYDSIAESRGIETESPRVTGRQVDSANEAMDNDFMFDNLQILTKNPSTENVIFCIDTAFSTSSSDQALIHNLSHIINNYIEMKKQIAVSPVNFAILLVGNEAVNYSNITTKKHVSSLLVALTKMEDEDKKGFDLKYMFDELAKTLKLPDERVYQGDKWPPHCYHLIFLFNRTKHIPCISDPNSYFFLMSSPFLSMDILYFNNRTSGNEISEVLQGIIPKNKGYFYECHSQDYSLQQTIMMRFLGHPQFRSPQSEAKFNVKSLNLEKRPLKEAYSTWQN